MEIVLTVVLHWGCLAAHCNCADDPCSLPLDLQTCSRRTGLGSWLYAEVWHDLPQETGKVLVMTHFLVGKQGQPKCINSWPSDPGWYNAIWAIILAGLLASLSPLLGLSCQASWVQSHLLQGKSIYDCMLRLQILVASFSTPGYMQVKMETSWKRTLFFFFMAVITCWVCRRNGWLPF